MASSSTALQAKADAIAPQSLLRIYWRRYRRNRAAVVGLVIVVIFTFLAIFAPLLAPYGYDEQNYDLAWQPPSREHIFGTDNLGRDQYSRILYGIRVAAMVGLGATGLSLGFGAIVGAISGLRGGLVDNILMRIVDITYSFPSFLLAVILANTLGQSVGLIIFALGITGWAGYARLVRGQVLMLRNQEYVHAARTLGASEGHIIRNYLLPNVLGPIIVSLSFGIPWAMLQEAALSVIGVGIRPPQPSWGNLINQGISRMRGFPYLAIWPTLFFSITLLGFTFMGDGLQEVFNPKGER
jgi:ABC-type dipeptide/oligopeptide/nickel transport system permease subunit